MQGFERGMVYLNLVAVVGLLFRLYKLGLFRIYRSLFFYLLAYTAQFLATATVPFPSTLYGYCYMAGETANVVLSILVVLELYKLNCFHDVVSGQGSAQYHALRWRLCCLLSFANFWFAHDQSAPATVYQRNHQRTAMPFLQLFDGLAVRAPARKRRHHNHPRSPLESGCDGASLGAIRCDQCDIGTLRASLRNMKSSDI